MASTPRPKLPPLYADALREPPQLPEASTLRESELPLSKEEFNVIRGAMAVHAVSRQPKLTWRGWTLIGAALEIAEKHVRKLSGNQTTGRAYNTLMANFLRATGFTFLNKGTRWALRQCILHIDEIEDWRETLDPNERAHLSNPLDVWTRFNEADKRVASGSKRRPKPGKKRLAKPTLLEYCIALEEKITALETQRDELQAILHDLQRDAGA